MANTVFIVGIVVFILLALFTVAIFLGYGVADKPQNSGTVPTVQNGFFLDDCSQSPCQPGLTCDGTNFTCRLSTGTACDTSTDCVSGLICSGLCESGPTGTIGALCPCNAGLVCIPDTSGLTVCKGGGGTPCTINDDCVSAICDAGVCTAGAPNSFPCVVNATCSSNNCNNGFCQAPGVITGSQGAACAGNCVFFEGAGCTGGLSCECSGGPNAPGTCATITQGITSGCGPSAGCIPQLVCFNTTGTVCDNQAGCFCAFPYTNPNAPEPGVECIGGMTEVSGVCRNNNGLGCNTGTECVSGACGGPSVVAGYTFGGNFSAAFAGAVDPAIAPLFPGPTGANPYKMFTLSQGTTDFLYLVDNTLGLQRLQYDAANGTVLENWTTLIPHTRTSTIPGPTPITVTQILVDVGTNLQNDPGGTFIVAFLETVTMGSSTRTNYTVFTWDGGTNFQLFNQQSGSGLPGTQYTTGGTPLTIDYIHVSPPNQVGVGGDVLISTNGTIYVKSAAATRYSVGIIQGGPRDGSPMTVVQGPAYFYYDIEENSGASGSAVCPEPGDGSRPINCPPANNIAFAAPFESYGGQLVTTALQFSGNIAGIAQPNDVFVRPNPMDEVQYEVYDYSIYSPTVAPPGGDPAGMQSAITIMLASAGVQGTTIGDLVALNYGGIGVIMPYQIDGNTRSAASANGYYIISGGSCS